MSSRSTWYSSTTLSWNASTISTIAATASAIRCLAWVPATTSTPTVMAASTIVVPISTLMNTSSIVTRRHADHPHEVGKRGHG